VVHYEVVMTVAMIAIARKVIILCQGTAEHDARGHCRSSGAVGGAILLRRMNSVLSRCSRQTAPGTCVERIKESLS